MIQLKDVSKEFMASGEKIVALKNVQLTIEDGEIYGIIGMSGAGKSTLVRCINLLERPSSGSVFLDDIDLTSLSASNLRKERRKIGMIFQQFNLLEQRNALKNICFPLELEGMSSKESIMKAEKLLELVGLTDRKNSYPSQLSGGQQQRVAIARALATDPKVLLCDEATSALDPETTRSILDLLKNINEQLGVTIIVITHEMRVIKQICHKVAVLDDGRVAEDGEVEAVFSSPQSDAAQRLLKSEGEVIEFNSLRRVK